MSDRKVRVRFAPSPTGPLHMGGVRTALYNYLFAKKHGGDFILRIEDTDQNRYVPGAEEYIIESLKWSGILPKEGVGFGEGEYKPYRQSERKAIYRQFSDQLVNDGHAYYAFDTEEELDAMRKRMEAAKASFSYNAVIRQNMKNSLTLSKDEVDKRIEAGENFVVRLKVPRNEEVRVKDIIRGWVVVQTSQMDDKVLFKSDGMPTYHLANVVDDYLMKITHVIRGEEWLPSAPLHVLLYRYLGWESVMPEFAHLPLLLKPDGNGKLSKRDGDRLGFPVFPLNWTDPVTGEQSSGYREKGYFPEAFINTIALLGWHPSGNEEVFSLDQLVEHFSLDRVSKSGAKFDPEKTKWFNQHYLRMKTDEELARIFEPIVREQLANSPDAIRNPQYIQQVCHLVKEKAYFINEFWSLGSYFFIAPTEYDTALIQKKWNDNSKKFFPMLVEHLKSMNGFSHIEIEQTLKQTVDQAGIKTGDIMQLFRVLLTGLPSGSSLFETAELLGKKEVIKRLETGLKRLTIEQSNQ